MEGSVNAVRFVGFIEALALKAGALDMAVILDNLRVHHSRLATQCYRRLGIRTIFILPYSPEMNAIEIFWSLVKQRYKKLKLSCLSRGITGCPRSMIQESIANVEISKIGNICQSVINKYY